MERYTDHAHWYTVNAAWLPMIVADNGDLVQADWSAFEQFFNQEFTSTTAALELYQ